MTRLHGWLVALSSVALLIPLAVLVILGNASLGAAALFLVLGATAAQALGSTLSNLLAAGQLRAEGLVRRGTLLTVAGPAGPVTATVRSLGLRVTVARDEASGLTLILPNSMLTSSTLAIAQPKEETHANR